MLFRIISKVSSVITNIFAANYLKEAMMLSINYLSNENTLSSVDKNRLHELANMCAYQYPKSVALSRALYDMFIIDHAHTYSDDCTMISTRSTNDRSTGMSVFPNPSHNVINISIDKSQDDVNFKIKIVNSLGAVVRSHKINTSETTVDVSDLANGIYFIISDTGESKKFIKLK